VENLPTDKNQIIYSAIIPAFNEAYNIEPLYKRLKAVLEGLKSPYEVIFVDDGSSDSTYRRLKDIAFLDNGVKVIGLAKNFGQHKAVVCGILEASGKYIITMDSDLQNPPEEIPKLVAKIKEGFDMVSGYRKMRKDSLKRRFFSLIANGTISIVTGLWMRDYGSMLRIFKRDTAKGLAQEFIKSQGYITMLVAKVTRNVAEIEVSHDQRYAGESKYNMTKLIAVFLRIFRYNRMKRRLSPVNKEEPIYTIGRRVENGEEIAETT